MSKKVSIIIPSWKGKKLLEKNLKSVLDTGAGEIIVVDDGSSDESQEVIKQFKEIKLITHKKNLGFVASVNDGVSKATSEVVVLLNNDVSPARDFLEPLLSHFNNDKIFAVSCNEPNFSWAWAKFENGFITHGIGEPTNTTHLSFWASGGSAAFSRQKWIKLGGMDELFRPFYWEDIDICYRAAKRGWKIYWEPESIINHEVSSTIKRYFSKEFISYIGLRNQFIFIWKNITSEKLISEHKSELFKKLLRGEMLRPFLGALIKLPKIWQGRKIEKLETKLTDEEIFDKFA